MKSKGLGSNSEGIFLSVICPPSPQQANGVGESVAGKGNKAVFVAEGMRVLVDCEGVSGGDVSKEERVHALTTGINISPIYITWESLFRFINEDRRTIPKPADSLPICG